MVTEALAHVRVGDCMHAGILSCSPDAPLAEVAGMMATHRVHAIAVSDRDGGAPLGIVSDADVVAAVAAGSTTSAVQAAATEPLAVSETERLDRAAQLMREHGITHLIVLGASDGRPIGVISTLDIAAAYAA